MEHSIEYIPHKMAAELRRLFPTLLNSFEMVRVDREVHRRAEVYVEDESVTKLAVSLDIITVPSPLTK
jgi:hypothetical protein